MEDEEWCDIFEKGRMAGVKEVTEWVEERLYDAGDEGYMQMAMDKSEWLDQLIIWNRFGGAYEE